MIEKNDIRHNIATYGAGIGCDYICNPTIQDNIIRDNTAVEEGGGIHLYDAVDMTTLIQRNEIRNNDAPRGGGIWVGDAGVVLRDNKIVGNEALLEAGGVWIGLYGMSELFGNLIAFNSSSFGGGMFLDSQGSLVQGNTFHGNAAPNGGGLATADGDKRILNNIFSGSEVGSGLQCLPVGTTWIGCNDIWGNAGGDLVPEGANDIGNNFHEDPLYCDVDLEMFTLNENSPCIDGNQGACGLVGAFGIGCGPTSTEASSWGRIKNHFR